MAITLIKQLPKKPEIWPGGGGILIEAWELTHDNASTSVVVTPDAIKHIFAAHCGDSTDNVAADGSSATVTFTFAAAKANGLTQTAMIYGKA